jgi:hypothetical protein
MHTFQFKQGYCAHQAARMAFSSLGLVVLSWHSGQWSTLGAAVLVAGCALVCFRNMMTDAPAFSFDDQNVRINTPFGVNELAWREITAIYMQPVGASMVMTMPFGGTMSICFQSSRRTLTFGRTWLPLGAIDLPPGGASELLETLNHTWEAAAHANRGSDVMSGALQDQLS